MAASLTLGPLLDSPVKVQKFINVWNSLGKDFGEGAARSELTLASLRCARAGALWSDTETQLELKSIGITSVTDIVNAVDLCSVPAILEAGDAARHPR